MWFRVLALALCLLIAQSLVLVAERNPPFIISSSRDGIVHVSSYFYDIRFNFNKGISIESWRIVLPNGSKVELLRLGSILPSVLLNMYTTEKPSRYEINVNGSRGWVDLSSLAFKPWSFEVVSNTTDLLTLKAKPTDEALADVSPLRVEATVKARIWSPAVEYTITFINPSNESVTLRGPHGGPEVILVADDGTPGNWIVSLADTGLGYLGGTADVKPGEPLRTINLEAVTLIRLANATDRTTMLYMAGFKPIQPLSYTILYQVGVRAGNITLNTPVILRLILPEVTIEPRGVYEVRFNVAYVYREPALVTLAGLEPAAIVANTGFLSQIIGLTNTEDYIRNVTRPLLDRIKQLEGNISRLESRVGELEGLKSFWENEISIRDNQINSLRAQISRANIISLGLLALGLILGFTGGLLASRLRREEVRVVRRERRR